MPIEFSCECGKAYKVADQYAGKRSKCTACGQPVLVPVAAPVPAAEESAEDAALKALLDGPDPEPSSAGRYAGRAEPPPRPAWTPPSARDTASDMRSRTTEVPKPSKAKKPTKVRESGGGIRFHVNWPRAVVGGVIMAAGGAWWAARGGLSIWGPLTMLSGLVTLVAGLLGKED